MTNDEADRWLVACGHFEMREVMGMTTYQIWNRHAQGPTDPSVGITVPGRMPLPEVKDVERFLVRWFVDRFGP